MIFCLYNCIIEFLSTHFYELTPTEEEKLCQLNIDTIECILQNSKLQLKDENQLIRIVNNLYSRDKTCSKLYENVLFSFVDESSIGEFIRLFDINNITQEIWINVSSRLKHKIVQTSQINNNNNLYKKNLNRKNSFIEIDSVKMVITATKSEKQLLTSKKKKTFSMESRTTFSKNPTVVFKT